MHSGASGVKEPESLTLQNSPHTLDRLQRLSEKKKLLSSLRYIYFGFLLHVA